MGPSQKGLSYGRWVNFHSVVGVNLTSLLTMRRAGQGRKPSYGLAERQRILAEVQRQPTPAEDGTAGGSVMMLRRALREAPDGLPRVSGYTIHSVLRGAGYRWLGNRSWCQTGQGVRRRKRGSVRVTDPDTEAKKT
jgi:hypothetical protein